MKFTNFSKLKLIVEGFGASSVIANLNKQLTERGIPVETSDERLVVADNGIYQISPSGVLTRVIIHIVDKDVRSKYSRNIQEFLRLNDFESHNLISALHKFHLVKCTTIERAEKEGWRKEKYRMSRSQDGGFYYRFIDDQVITEKERQKLFVCKNCLKVINSLLDKNDTPSTFDVKLFLSSPIIEEHGLPKQGDYADMCAPNMYKSDWAEISKKYRQLKGYKCESLTCPSPDLSEKKYNKYLHTHHVSHDKSDNSYSNLMALCIYCHGAQPNHGQIKKTPDYVNYTTMRSI